MREIKFRAWIPNTKTGKGHLIIINNEEIDELIEEGCAVMQFTGLQDSKGVDIYEGDIVLPSSGVIGSIVFHNGAFTYTDGACHWWMVSDRTSMPSEFGSDTDMEVIGNIHETPELLK